MALGLRSVSELESILALGREKVSALGLMSLLVKVS
jgi:hypothetical protein